eukprot:359832-Chlamydomonas_euryale.AAC.6
MGGRKGRKGGRGKRGEEKRSGDASTHPQAARLHELDLSDARVLELYAPQRRHICAQDASQEALDCDACAGRQRVQQAWCARL